MSRRRFFAPPDSFNHNSKTVLLSAAETRHLRGALRLTKGDRVFVFDGEGREYECAVKELQGDTVQLETIDEVVPSSPESSIYLRLALALLKGEKFDFAVQKTTELGVSEIIPLQTQFADIRLRDARDAEQRVMRWQRIALEAAKQSGRAFVPRVSTPLDFTQFAKKPDKEARIMFSEKCGEPSEPIIMSVTGSNSVTALVGPEGGWSDDEINLARDCSIKIITLGGRILRAETAAIAITALLQHRLGDFR